MKYQIKKCEIVKVDDVATKQILTLEVAYDNDTTTEHGKEIALDADIQAEAITFAAELDQVLQEPKVITTEEVKIADKDKAVDSAEVEAAVAANSLQSEDLAQPIEEVTPKRTPVELS